jgi:predicted lipoprotein
VTRRTSWALAALVLAGCVIVSTETITPPARDAGTDRGPSEPDARGIDAPGIDAPRMDVPAPPVLTREEATRGVLESTAGIALATYRALAMEAAALEAAAQAHATARSDGTLAAVRESWIRTMDVAQRAELLQLGPAAMATMEDDHLGARGLRDAIYVFPTNRCYTDVAVQRRTYDDLEALASQPAFARGLGAMEYQLFATGTEHGCDPGALVRVDDAEWDTLGPEGIRQRRAEASYADAQLVRRAADALLAAWAPEGEDFAGQLARAGAGPSLYPTSQTALNYIYRAMYYAERWVKDEKLGLPLGINERCTEPSCPDLLESRWAGRSAEHLAANLAAAEQLFLGGPAGTEAIGFDDLLRSIGQDAIAIDMTAAIAAARAQAEALPPIDATTFAANEAALRALRDAVAAFTNQLKNDLPGVLGFSPPPGAGEDDDS